MTKIKSLWQCAKHQAWCWGKVLVVCRVPFVSAVGGGLVLNFSQAKDFFADLGLEWWQWIAFFGLLLGWALMVHAVARRALQHDDWVIESHVGGGLTPEQRTALQQEFMTPAVLVPRLLGLFVPVSVAWAIYSAGANLLTADDLPEINAAYGGTSLLWKIALIAAALYGVLIWKRRNLQGYIAKRAPSVPQPGGPLLTGTWVFPHNLMPSTWGSAGNRQLAKFDLVLAAIAGVITVVFGIAIFYPHFLADIFPRALIAPVLFSGGLLFFGEIAAWSHYKRAPILLFVVLAMVFTQFLAGRFHDIRWVDAPKTAVGPAQIDLATAIERWKAVNPPIKDAEGKPIKDENGKEQYPRPIIVAGAGGASRAGFMTASVIGAMIDYGIENNRPVRNRIFAISAVSGSSVGAAVVRAALADAVDRNTPDTPPCSELREPSEGGRAWYGSLVLKDQRRSFRPNESWRHCFQRLLAGDFLSPVIVGLGYRDGFPIGSRLGLVDRAVLLEQAFERRYHQIAGQDPRKSAGGHAGKIAEGGARICKPTDNDGLCRRLGYHPDLAAKDVWLPLLFLNASSGETGRRILLSDVKSGSTYRNGNNIGTLLPQAFDIMELRTSKKDKCYRSWIASVLDLDETRVSDFLGLNKKDCGPNDHEKDTTLHLSTAATISARFPVISPYATVRDVTQNIVDLAVDGGYFENGGLATSADLVWALKAAGLDPVVVSVSNDPLKKPDADRCPDGQPARSERSCTTAQAAARPALPEYSSTKVLGGFTSIFFALYRTREGHQEGSLGYLNSSMLGKHRHFDIGVRPIEGFSASFCPKHIPPSPTKKPREPQILKEVSMSWWASQPVQAYLDEQLCVNENVKELACELRSGGLSTPEKVAADCARM